MTLVSIKNTWRFDWLARTLEIRVDSDIWHAGQNFHKATPTWVYQRGGQYLPMLGLCATAMGTRARFECFDDVVPDASNQQICHFGFS